MTQKQKENRTMNKLEITTHSNTDEKGRPIIEIIGVEEYDALETANIINGVTKNEIGNPHNVLVLGDNIYSCIDIKNIRVIKEEPIEEEPKQSAE